MKNKRVLFTARDVGAAQQIKPIALFFKRKGYRVSVVADGPAYGILKDDVLGTVNFSGRYGAMGLVANRRDDCTGALLKSAGLMLKMVKPDIVFCGLSTIGMGIDEATLWWAAGRRKAIPSCQFLDTWGTFNHFEDGYPDIYLAMDRYAEYLAFKGAMAPIRVVGSPKHYIYADKPIEKWRRVVRAAMNIGKNDKLIGYFGQCHEVPGHRHNFTVLIDALKHSIKTGPAKLKLLFRPHPAYSSQSTPYIKYLRREGINYLVSPEGLSIEMILAACDIAVTSYSTIALDHAHLSCHSPIPIGATLYLLCGEDLKKHLMKNFGYWKLPPLKAGIGYCAEKDEEVFDLVKRILYDKELERAYRSAAKSLHTEDPFGKIENIVSSLSG